jgi:hypothetical protein
VKKVGIIGCGWLGYRIAENFRGQFEVYTTTTTDNKKEKLTASGCHPTVVRFPDDTVLKDLKHWDALSTLDIIIITVPFSGKDSLTNRAQNLFSFIGDFKGQLLFMSTTGVYPDIAKEFSEDDVSPDSVLGERMIKEKFPQVNILRLAGLMGDDRLLRKYNVANLHLAVNHIHYLDICAVLKKIIELELNSKSYNVVAPLHPAKSEVINAQNNIPCVAQTEVGGRKVSSGKLRSELNFVFKFPDPRSFHLQ